MSEDNQRTSLNPSNVTNAFIVNISSSRLASHRYFDTCSTEWKQPLVLPP